MNSYPFNIVPEQIPPELQERLSSHAWGARVLSDTRLTPIQTPSRVSKPGTENSFLAQTLRTGDAITACQSFYKAPSPPSDSESHQGSDSANLGEMQTLYVIGSGLNGHEGVCHGGFLSLVLDEIMGLVVRLYPKAANPYTLYLNVSFKKPLSTPAVIVCRGRFTKLQGRKMWVSGSVEDGEGGLYATGESLFLEVKGNL
jgi:thioesterase superfamily protein 4